MRFTDEKKYFVSEASVYRLLKAQDLITSPAYIVIKAAEEFKDKTTAPNQLWQTDYLKIVGWGWYYLSTVLDEGRDVSLEIAGQIVILEQDAVLECLVPALDLALGLRMIGGAADMVHFPVIEPFGQVGSDI